MKKMKVKSILMLAFAFTAILLASCNKENDNQTTENDNQPQTPSEMIVGKWKSVEDNSDDCGHHVFKNPTATVGTVWTFKDDGTLIIPNGVEVYNIIEGNNLQLHITNYDRSDVHNGFAKYYDMTLTNNELTLYRKQQDDYGKETSHRNIFNVKFIKIQ